MKRLISLLGVLYACGNGEVLQKDFNKERSGAAYGVGENLSGCYFDNNGTQHTVCCAPSNVTSGTGVCQVVDRGTTLPINGCNWDEFDYIFDQITFTDSPPHRHYVGRRYGRGTVGSGCAAPPIVSTNIDCSASFGCRGLSASAPGRFTETDSIVGTRGWTRLNNRPTGSSTDEGCTGVYESVTPPGAFRDVASVRITWPEGTVVKANPCATLGSKVWNTSVITNTFNTQPGYLGGGFYGGLRTIGKANDNFPNPTCSSNAHVSTIAATEDCSSLFEIEAWAENGGSAKVEWRKIHDICPVCPNGQPADQSDCSCPPDYCPPYCPDGNPDHCFYPSCYPPGGGN